MSATAQPDSGGRPLEIRTLHVAAGDGSTAEYSSVRCPREGCALPLERCLACEEGGGTTRDPSGRHAFVSCRSAGAGVWRGAPASPGDAPSTAADRTPVAAVMTRRVLAVRPDVSLEALTGLFLDRDIGGAPVVDDGGRPIGVVSKTDLLRVQRDSGDTREAVASGRQPSRGQLRVELGPGFHAEALPRVVAEAMTRAAYTISENAPLTHAAALMAFEGVHRVPVVSEDGRVAGMVTAIDILRWLAQQDGYLVPAGAGLEAHELSGLPATLAGVDSPRRPGPARSRPRRSR